MLQNQNSGWALLYLLRFFTLQVPKRMPKYISHRVRPLYFCEKYVIMIYRIIIMIKKRPLTRKLIITGGNQIALTRIISAVRCTLALVSAFCI